MRPGPIPWATNANHAAGADPWSAQPNKIPPAAGKIATGRVPEELPPAEETNYVRSVTGELANRAATQRLASLGIVSDTLAAAGYTLAGIQIDYCWEGALSATTIAQYAWGMGYQVAGNHEECQAANGWVWRQIFPGGVIPGAVFPASIASHINGDRGMVGSGIVDAVYASPAPLAAWQAWGFGAALGLTWTQMECDKIPAGDTWVIYDNNSAAPHIALGHLLPFAPVAAPPGFAVSPCTLRHSHHQAGDVYDSDAGNSVWMALTATEISTSADGDTWLPAALHGLSAAPMIDALAYSKAGSRWVTVLNKAAATIAYSDDNGLSWAEVTLKNPLGIDVTLGGGSARIACDGYGHWIVAYCDTAGANAVQLEASADNGETWHLIYPEEQTALAPLWPHLALAYGGGRFYFLSADGAGNFYAASSATCLD